MLSATIDTISKLRAINGDDAIDDLDSDFVEELCDQSTAVGLELGCSMPTAATHSFGFEPLAATVSNIKMEAPMYSANRKQAVHILNKLSVEYMVKERAQKAKALTGKKRILPESSDESSDPPTDPDEDEDEDDDE